MLQYECSIRDATDRTKRMLGQAKEKGSPAISSSRYCILNIEQVRRAFGHMRTSLGHGVMNFDKVEVNEIMHEIASRS